MIVRIASGPYAHVAGVAGDGRPDGLDVRLDTLEPGRIFRRMLDESAWDVAEMSLATVYMLADKADRRFTAIPVFPSRAFRHSALYVSQAAGAIRSPADLRGARIGVLRYAMTTAVWVRQLIAARGVPASAMSWFVGEPSAHPDDVRPTVVAGMEALEGMAARGEIDVLISGRVPASFKAGKLRRLFADFLAEEKAYFAATGVFPIMHVMVARSDLLAGRPELRAALLRRFEAAKALAEERLVNSDISAYPLPWLAGYVEDAQGAAGAELWPYGTAANARTLSAFAAAVAADGLTQRVLAPQEVFVEPR